MSPATERETRAQDAGKTSRKAEDNRETDKRASLTINLNDSMYEDVIDNLITNGDSKYKYGMFSTKRGFRAGWEVAPYDDLDEIAKRSIQPEQFKTYGNCVLNGEDILLRMPIERWNALHAKYVDESYLKMEGEIKREIVSSEVDAGGELRMDGDE